MRICYVVLIGSSASNLMNQARFSVCADLCFHTEGPLVAFLGLVHLLGRLTRAVLGRAGSCNQSGKGQDQVTQLYPRHNKIHLVDKLALTPYLGDQFKSGAGEGGFFHQDITVKSDAKMNFTELS